MPQTQVRKDMAQGVEGDIYDNGPRRSDPFELTTNVNAAGVNGKVGYWFSQVVAAPTTAVSGASANSVTGGILVTKNQYANWASLQPSLEIKEHGIGELLSMGRVIVRSHVATAVGDQGCYADATGIISAAPGGVAPLNHTLIPNSHFITSTANADELAVLEITN